MPVQMPVQMHVMTRLYKDHATAMRAVEDIEALALPSVEPSILGGEGLRDYRDMRVGRDPVSGVRTQTPEPAPATAAGGALGAAVGGSAGLLAGLGLIAVPGLGPVAAGGWLISALTGAAGGALAGASFGALVDLGIEEEDADLYSDSFRQGGVAVAVRFPEEHREALEAALAQTGASSLADLRRAQQERPSPR